MTQSLAIPRHARFQTAIALLFVILSISFPPSLVAQSAIYATGSAVADGPVQLTRFPDGSFKFAGTLQEGTLLLRTTADETSTTRYLTPTYEDSYLINHGLTYRLTSTPDEGWVVPVSEDRYRFTVNTSKRTVTGELFTAWNELFIVGGAVECGWNSYVMLPFTRLDDEICTWRWVGELKERSENVEPRRFKFTGQNAWDPKVLHPFKADEDIMNTTYLRTGGSDDTKWQITSEGTYEITIDVFRETASARKIK